MTATDKFVTLMGVFQCLTLFLPLGFYKIEPPPSSVGTLWGFLVAPTYITFIVGMIILFRYQIQTRLHVKADILIILSGIMTIMTFVAGYFLYPLTQTLIMEFHQVTTHSGAITYLDVETGGIVAYFLYGLGLLFLGLGVKRFNHSNLEALDSERLPN